MTCQQIQDELLLLIGEKHLPEELQKHLAGCEQCRSFYDELTSAVGQIGSDEDFFVGEAEVERMVQKVDEKIDTVELTKVTNISSIVASYVPAAAAVILVVGVSFMAYMFGWFGGNGQQMAWVHPDSTLVDVNPEIIAEIDDNDMDYFFYGSSTGDYQATSNLLFEEMTEEDLKYLDENFDVKEIL